MLKVLAVPPVWARLGVVPERGDLEGPRVQLNPAREVLSDGHVSVSVRPWLMCSPWSVARPGEPMPPNRPDRSSPERTKRGRVRREARALRVKGAPDQGKRSVAPTGFEPVLPALKGRPGPIL